MQREHTLHGRLEKQTTTTEANNPTKKNSTVWATRRTFVPTHMRMEASRPDRTFEAAESVPPGHSVLRLGFARGIGSLNARSLTLHHTRGGLAQQRRLRRILLRQHPDACQRCNEQNNRDPSDYLFYARQGPTSFFEYQRV